MAKINTISESTVNTVYTDNFIQFAFHICDIYNTVESGF